MMSILMPSAIDRWWLARRLFVNDPADKLHSTRMDAVISSKCLPLKKKAHETSWCLFEELINNIKVFSGNKRTKENTYHLDFHPGLCWWPRWYRIGFDFPGSRRPPGEGNGYPLQESCLEKSMDRGAWRVTVYGAAKSQTHLSD